MEANPNKNLIVFTNQYPYGTGETFLENELTALSPEFETIYLVPLMHKGPVRPLPVSNIKLANLFERRLPGKNKILLQHFFLFLNILFYEYRHVAFPGRFMKSIAYYRSILLVNLQRAQLLKEWLYTLKQNRNVLYSFWMDDWATILSILKTTNKISSFVGRVHGYDLYESRWSNGMIPFRRFQLKNVHRIIAASKDGYNYLKENYPSGQGKFFLKHLNVFDRGTNPFYEHEEIVVVSCSNVIPLKRVHLIPSLLKHLQQKIKWIHFGDGTEFSKLQQQIKLLPENISVELRKHVTNPELIHFYQTQQVNVFLHLSETEGGVPLVLQEAASFGIPLMATAAGGIPEIVTNETGILIPVEFDEKMVLDQLKTLLSPAFNNQEFRNGVKAFWNRNFNAAHTNKGLVNLILN